MINTALLPKQPRLFVSYWNVGSLLYFSVLIFILETLFYWSKFKEAYEDEMLLLSIFWFGSVLFAFSHIFLVMMDGWSRFQNYKRVKDYFFVHGFTPKVAARYKGSKCQRTAVMIAAKELGMEQQAVSYYNSFGIKWFHMVPQFMVDDPWFIFHRYFWSRTFLEKPYTSKFDFQALNSQILYNAERK